MKNIFASTTFGVQIFFLITLLGTIYGIFQYELTLPNILLILLGYFLYGCLGIVITFHRNLTHNSYKTYPIITKIFSILGCLGGTGSPLAWASIHVNHHLKSDKEGDPHSPLHKGLKIFILDYKYEIDSNTKWKIKKLVTNKFQQFLHRYYFGIIFLWNLILFLIGDLYLVIFLHWIPVLITILMSNIVNYVGHKPNYIGGHRLYNLNDQSSNNWIFSVISWGESWHNNHHRFPTRHYFGDKWYQLDISGLIIKLIKI